ncbi:MAG: NINE protein [Fusobacteria bacterium]|nr:NINE protein [Fusobacteriota bacterium]
MRNIACPVCHKIFEVKSEYCPHCNSKILKKVQGVAKVQKKRAVAGWLAILVGSVGMHKFYLGYNKQGIVMLIISFICAVFASTLYAEIIFCIVALIGILEGVTYLRKTDKEFNRIYIRNQQYWF